MCSGSKMDLFEKWKHDKVIRNNCLMDFILKEICSTDVTSLNRGGVCSRELQVFRQNLLKIGLHRI